MMSLFTNIRVIWCTFWFTCSRTKLVIARSAFYVLCVLDRLRSMSVVSVCDQSCDELPRGSRGVTALWPRGVLNEMIRNSQKHCFWTSFKHDLGAVNRD